MVIGYNTHLAESRAQMLQVIGVSSIEELFARIPENLRLVRELQLPGPTSPWDLEKHVQSLANRNLNTKTDACFLGGGVYEHYVPAVVDAIVSRGEYLTSYTPYQPEMSQGLLQALYEYQELAARITGHEVVNSSCYDGSTALSDAAWVSCVIGATRGKQNLILASEGIWRRFRAVLQTYMRGRKVEIQVLPNQRGVGRIDPDRLNEALGDNTIASFLFQSPNCNGVVEDVSTIAQVCAAHQVISILSFHPMLSALLGAPGHQGVDIVSGEGQSLGIPLRAGGSSLGIFATRREFRKYVPGRLVGKVNDIRGNLAYSLVLEDREQHVAREKATSNICSNQALNAIRAAVYLTLVGEDGLRSIAQENAEKARYLCARLCELSGVKRVYLAPFFNEFLLEFPKPVTYIQRQLRRAKIFGGLQPGGEGHPESHRMLIAVTETKTKDELDHYVSAMKEALAL